MICGANSCVWVLMYKIIMVHKTHNPAAIGVALPSLLDHLPVCIGQAEIKLFLHNDPVDNQGMLQEFVFKPGQICIRVQLHFDSSENSWKNAYNARHSTPCACETGAPGCSF